MPISIPKGVFDVLPFPLDSSMEWNTSERWAYVESVAIEVARSYGFEEIRIPIFEHTELFIRSVGEQTDIAQKEMFTFLDRGNRSLSLRPEGTASVMRSYVENHLSQRGLPQKYYYLGSMFRYERPQAGRYRQFGQFGLEAIGSPSAYQDAEVIDLMLTIYKKLGLKKLQVMINSVGTPQTRKQYLDALRAFFAPRLTELSQDSQTRFEKNVLRILDSKDTTDKKIIEGAPSILDFLDDASKQHFALLQTLLGNLGIDFVINDKLVRGLDYYTKTVFEITCDDLGAQSTLAGGGRYDNLIQELEGPATPSVGFAMGLERLLQVLHRQNAPIKSLPRTQFLLIALGQEAKCAAFSLLKQLREHHLMVEMEYSDRKIGATLQSADKKNIPYALILGEEELAGRTITLKSLKERSSDSISLDKLINHLKTL